MNPEQPTPTWSPLGSRPMKIVFIAGPQKVPVTEAYYKELARIIRLFQPPPSLAVVDKKETDRKREQILTQLRLANVFVDVQFEQSHHVKQLQAADFVAWAIGRYYERGDDSFMNLLPRITQI